MKIKNTSRIIAFALVVMMIVPLIGVPAFAAAYEDEARSVYYNNDFESYVLDAKTEEAEDPDGDPNAHVVVADDYFAGNPNAGMDVPANTVVKNPNGEGLVFQTALSEANLNNNAIVAKIDEISCNDVDSILIENAVYIPTGAVGKLQWQFGNDGYDWTPLYNICMDANTEDNNPGRAYVDRTSLNAAAAYDGELQLTRDQWHTISYLLNLDSGLFNLFVDGDLAAAGTFGGTQNNITTLPDRLHFAKLEKNSTNAAGFFYVDNMSVTVAEEEPIRPPLFECNFDDVTMDETTLTHDLDGDGTKDAVQLTNDYQGVKAMGASPENFAVLDPTDSENVVWRASMGKPAEDKRVNLGIAPSYMTYPNVLTQWDMYVPTGATGRVQYQYVLTKPVTWFEWINFNVTTASFEAGSGYMAAVGSLTLTRDEWHTIAVAQNFATGEYSLYIDNQFVAFGEYTLANLIVRSNSDFFFGKVQSGQTGEGYILYDNLSVTGEEKPEGTVGGVDSYEPSWYEQDFEEFADGENISNLFPHRKAFNGAYEDYFVADVDGDKAWKREMNPSFNDAWSYLNTPIVSYKFAEKIVIESSYYIPTGATGYFVAQAYGANTSVEGKAGSPWMHLYAVDVTNGKLLKHNSADVFEVVNDEVATLARDTWVEFTYVINLTYGDFDIFVDGEHAATGRLSTGHSKITFSEGYIDVCNATNLANEAYIPAEGSFVYVDDVSVTAYANQVVDYVNIKEDLVSATINGEEIALGGKYLLGEDDVYEEVLFDRAKYTAMLGDITAEIRLCTDDGFRFKTEIDKDVLAEMAAEEYNAGENGLVMGTIIIPADYLEDPSALSFKLLNDLGKVEGKDYLNVVAKDCYEDADGTYIAGSILKLQEWNYARDFVAVSYVQMTLPMGNTSTVYGAVCEPASAAWTAFELVDAAVDGDYLPEEMAILEKFAEAYE